MDNNNTDMDQHLSTKSTLLVNKDDDIFNTLNDEFEINKMEELNFDNAWALLNALESESLDQIKIPPSTLQTTSSENLIDDKEIHIQSSDDLATPILLNNLLDLPLDISTPDVDTTMLNADTPEFFNSINTKSYLPIVEPQMPEQQAVELDNSTYDQESTTQPSSNKTPILTLNIGSQGKNILSGNGAQLQLKRKASGVQSQLPVVEVKTVESIQGQAAGSVMTIIITLGNNEQSSTTEASLSDGSDDQSPPEKISRQEDKYNEMRKKNNEASRRSRRTRKEKEKEMQSVAKKLEQENSLLRAQVETLEKQIHQVKTELISVFQSKRTQV